MYCISCLIKSCDCAEACLQPCVSILCLGSSEVCFMQVSSTVGSQFSSFFCIRLENLPLKYYVATDNFVAFAIPPDDMAVVNVWVRAGTVSDMTGNDRENIVWISGASSPKDPPVAQVQQLTMHMHSNSSLAHLDVIQHCTALWACILKIWTVALQNVSTS